MWRSARELHAALKAYPDVASLAELYALRGFWRSAVYPPDYRATEEWQSVLKLTEYGNQVMAELAPLMSDLPQSDVLLAYFGCFYRHELFFDAQISDREKIRSILQRELLDERIRLPHRFGRLLYDRFNDTYTETRTDHLMSADVQKLLQGTPQGIYQLGKMVSGPLGIIDSQEKRLIPPSLHPPLWHCSDTGCSAIHRVGLIPPTIPVTEAFSRIEKHFADTIGPPSEWELVLDFLHRGPPDSYRNYVDLPVVISDCIVGSERTSLLDSALQASYGDLLRNTLASPPRTKRSAEGPSRQLASKLTPEVQVQILLTLSDADIVSLIDDCVRSKVIKIPLGETRRPESHPPRRNRDSLSQLSALGLRSVREDAVVNLSSAVWNAYQRTGLVNELEWRVRGDSPRSTKEALLAFIREKGPADAVRELILSSGQITKSLCEDLRMPLKQASLSDTVVVDRLLWKLGFNPMQFDDSISRFRARLSEFNEKILSSTPIETEDARAQIRAAGVNVFVSVEDFLDRLVSYSVWLLSSDHFVLTKFRYSSTDARRCVAAVLGDSLPSGETALSWNLTGENSLGTLLRYLRAATDWIQNLQEKTRSDIRRAEEDLPHFAEYKILPFPFRHTALWADSEPGELQVYADGFARIVKLIEESDLATVRNGLDHFREGERFPSADKLLACVARLGPAVELADINRFLPKVFWLFGRKGNRFGSVEYEFRDYAGRQVFVYGPPLFSGLPRIRYENPSILAPCNLLGSPNSALIFQIREVSEYSEYWKQYPRRRRIPAGSDETTS